MGLVPEQSRFGCPACANPGTQHLELIDLARQHQHYAPVDALAQAALNHSLADDLASVRMVRCGACGLEYARPLRAPGEAWYEVAYRQLALYPEDRWEFRYLLSWLDSGDVLGEIGCGSGRFLGMCSNAGVRAHGLDFAPDAVAACRARGLSASILDIKTALADESAVPVEFANPRAIVAFHVLEHLDDPVTLFRAARTWIGHGGELWVSVPSDRRPSRYFGRTDYLDQPPHHLTRWTPQAMKAVALQAGWEMAEAIYEPMTIRGAMWHFATASKAYERLHSTRLFRTRWAERLLRWGLYPVVGCRLAAGALPITGFSLLVRFREVRHVT